jgi:NDP-sugar pyrophosphorylase family protein
MRAGIIAAGEGSRLRSEGINLPKPLVSIDGIPLIERLIRVLAGAGIDDVVCIVNEDSHEVKKFVEERRLEIPVQFVVKSTPSSMHSLFALAPYLAGGQFLLSTIDSIFSEAEFSDFLHHGEARSTVVDGILAVTDFVDDENPLFVQLDGQSDRILSFSKTNASPLVTGGLYVFSPRVFDEMETALAKGVNRLRNFLSLLIEQAYRLEAFRFSKMIDVDRAHDIAVAADFLKAR